MLYFKHYKDVAGEWIATKLRGKALLNTFLLNKGSAFTYKERQELGLLGKLPYKVEDIEEQSKRVYHQFSKYSSAVQKNIYLNNLHDKNEILFYKVLQEHLAEMLPIVYTPTIADSVLNFSYEFRQPRGLFISYPDMDEMENIFSNRTHPEIDITVVTDGERVLGLGDQGIGGINISIAKAVLYSACGGIDPYRCLPITLDVGTDNEELLQNPFYLGWRHKRIRGPEYFDFIDKFVALFRKIFPCSLLHWEDFGKDTARVILERYQNSFCTFNDDLQGTAIVAIAALLRAVAKKGNTIGQEKIVIFGAGTAGCGIADYIVEAMLRDGLSAPEAYSRIYLVDKEGLLGVDTLSIAPHQQKYLKKQSGLNLLATINLAKPSVLIGCSSLANAFSQEILIAMSQYNKMPIILPLSNPGDKAEAQPEAILQVNSQSLIATGSPYPGVTQCNNALCFPGIGLGITISKPSIITRDMLWQAVTVLSNYPVPAGYLLPTLSDLPQVALAIAEAIVKFNQGDAAMVAKHIWQPYYRAIKPLLED